MANTVNQPIYITFADLAKDYSLPKSSVYNLIKTEGFPVGTKISKQSVRFKRADVEAWFANREKQSKGVA